MRTEPPTGDELTRLLTTMKGEVLRMAASNPPAPERRRSNVRRRALGVLAAVVSVILVGGAGAALALGVIPGVGAPAPVVTASATPAPGPTATMEPPPAVETAPAPPPVTPEPVAVDPLDPGTWTIGYDEMAGLRLGDSLASFASAAGLVPVDSPADCPDGFWTGQGYGDGSLNVSVYLAQLEVDGEDVPDPLFTFAEVSTRGVADAPLEGSPSTPEGIRLGSSEADLLAAYPDIQVTFTRYDDEQGLTTYVNGPVDGRFLVFQVGTSPSGIKAVERIRTSTQDRAYGNCD
jgi:hypothetical protein